MKITKRDIEAKLERVVDLLGAHMCKRWDDVNGLSLDYQPCYGGYALEQISNDQGACRQLTPWRMKPTEFYIWLCGIEFGIEKPHMTRELNKWKEHYNSPYRFQAPWVDAGKHRTRTAGLRRIWLYPPSGEKYGNYWTAAIAGEGSTCGETKEQALANARKW